MHHLFGIFLNPREQWAKIRDDNDSVAALFLKFIVLIALVPPLARYFGAIEVGWTIGGSNPRFACVYDSSCRRVLIF